jgi:polysaccharide export outer membrane protein
MIRSIIAVLVLVSGAALSAQAQEAFVPSFGTEEKAAKTPQQKFAPSPKSEPAPVAEASSGMAYSGMGYKMGPQDVIEISVFNVAELNKTLQIGHSGAINYPLLGEIQAAGRTPEELERDLTARLGAEYLQDPVVTVFVKEYNSQRVILSGQVEKPGVYPVRGQTTLLELIAMAGGLKEMADSTVLVMRQTGGKQTAARFDVSDIEKGQMADPTMQAGDKVVAGTSMIKQTWGRFLRALPVAGTFAIF